MARAPRRKVSAARAVFINCPFDDAFKPILRAMIFTIIASGHHPRSALDATDGADVRVSKIAKMIGECDWGIHDLSRVEVDVAGVPRFNMPMELGVHLGARLLGEGRHRRKRALILEAERHRYDALLSDVSGQDIEAHGNDPDQAIRWSGIGCPSIARTTPLHFPELRRSRATTAFSRPRSARSWRLAAWIPTI